MRFPEYLDFFSREGNIEVEVKFKNGGHVSNVSMNACEILKIVSGDEGFLNKMEFDGHYFDIYKYEIDPIKNKLIIKAR